MASEASTPAAAPPRSVATAEASPAPQARSRQVSPALSPARPQTASNSGREAASGPSAQSRTRAPQSGPFTAADPMRATP